MAKKATKTAKAAAVEVPKRPQVTVPLSEVEYVEFRNHAASEGRTLADWCRRMIRRAIKHNLIVKDEP